MAPSGAGHHGCVLATKEHRMKLSLPSTCQAAHDQPRGHSALVASHLSLPGQCTETTSVPLELSWGLEVSMMETIQSGFQALYPHLSKTGSGGHPSLTSTSSWTKWNRTSVFPGCHQKYMLTRSMAQNPNTLNSVCARATILSTASIISRSLNGTFAGTCQALGPQGFTQDHEEARFSLCLQSISVISTKVKVPGNALQQLSDVPLAGPLSARCLE